MDQGIGPALSAMDGSARLPALRYRDYRLLWSGQVITTIGSQMQLIAVNWNVYNLLKSATYTLSFAGQHLTLGAGALGLGLLGLVRVLPIMVFALLGGMLADSLDRRRVVMASQLAAIAGAGTLAALSLSGHISLAALYLLTAVDAAAGAFEEPA